MAFMTPIGRSLGCANAKLVEAIKRALAIVPLKLINMSISFVGEESVCCDVTKTEHQYENISAYSLSLSEGTTIIVGFESGMVSIFTCCFFLTSFKCCLAGYELPFR
jgi:hypothetical protein